MRPKLWFFLTTFHYWLTEAAFEHIRVCVFCIPANSHLQASHRSPRYSISVNVHIIFTSAEARDYVTQSVCLFLCLSVACSESYERILMDVCWAIRHDQRRNWLDFGGDPGSLWTLVACPGCFAIRRRLGANSAEARDYVTQSVCLFLCLSVACSESYERILMDVCW